MANDGAQPVMLCRCGKALESPSAYAAHCAEFPDHFTATPSERDKALDEAAAVARRRAEIPADCESLGPMDPETGVRECALETRGTCICAERAEEADKIADQIRALKGKK